MLNVLLSTVFIPEHLTSIAQLVLVASAIAIAVIAARRKALRQSEQAAIEPAANKALDLAPGE
jgi:hypothetical protein